ncbi:MAG TPA: transglutaminase domain-containing protein [Bacteroidales bacterium]|nr:transglutaminase domain-containing protein [Bacteroidales bacterium]
MKFSFCFLFISIALILSCGKYSTNSNSNDFSEDYNFKEEILSKYGIKVFDEIENTQIDSLQIEYLKFLVAYMPLSDIMEFDFEFFKTQVDYAILARKNFSWAKDIPEEIFKHYVLPYRVNNEVPDTARIYFYNLFHDLKLWQDSSVEKVVLEVNNRCHSMITYRGTDERTISPMDAIKACYGRCGEESTFLVTALHSVGIPARQVYVPRWAHTDDNHAWVEVYVNGNWKYIGACEPAPILNYGWFSEHATRAILVHTREFGGKNQNLKTLSDNPNFRFINRTSDYAQTKKIIVVPVIDGVPILNAEIKFYVLNYCELYPIHISNSGFKGYSIFEIGYGSLDVIAVKDSLFGFVHLLPESTSVIKIDLKQNNLPDEFSVYYAPVGYKISRQEIDFTETQKRIHHNDSLRNSKISGFYTKNMGDLFCKTFKYDKKLQEYLIKAAGNWQEIENFLISASYKNIQKYASELIYNLPEKDLIDTKTEILEEHLFYSLENKNPQLDDELFIKFVLSPRIEFEPLRKYRKNILGSIDEGLKNLFYSNVKNIINYVDTVITTFDRVDFSELNSYNVAISPAAVNKYKIADVKSKMIYCVALCRSLGIPAYFDKVFKSVHIYDINNKIWYEFYNELSKDKGILKLNIQIGNPNQKYWSDFTIANIDKNKIQTLEYEWGFSIQNFIEGIELPEGNYMLTISKRDLNGNSYVKRTYFKISKNKVTVVPFYSLEVPNFKIEKKVLKNKTVYNKYSAAINSSEILNKNGFTVLCWVNPNEEPSLHLISDLNKENKNLHQHSIKTIFLIDDNKIHLSAIEKFNVEFFVDKNYELLNLNSEIKQLPLLIIVNNNEIIFLHSGYLVSMDRLVSQLVSQLVS